MAQHDFFTGHVSLDRSAVHLMLAIAVRTVDSPHRPIALRRDRAPHQVLPHPRCRDRLAPLAIAVRFDEQLIAELRRVVRLEILGLFLELHVVEAAVLLLELVADVRQPERTVGRPALGRGLLTTPQRRRGGDEPDHGAAVLDEVRLAGQDVLQRHLLVVDLALLDADRQGRVRLDVGQVQDDADRGERFERDGRRHVRRCADRLVRRRLPAVPLDQLVAGAEAIAFAVNDHGAADGGRAGP